jgi:hypothetical protein
MDLPCSRRPTLGLQWRYFGLVGIVGYMFPSLDTTSRDVSSSKPGGGLLPMHVLLVPSDASLLTMRHSSAIESRTPPPALDNVKERHLDAVPGRKSKVAEKMDDAESPMLIHL